MSVLWKNPFLLECRCLASVQVQGLQDQLKKCEDELRATVHVRYEKKLKQ